MHEVHNAQVGHCGVKELYTRLNKQFPGHGIAYKQVEDFIDRCACCQKTRKERKSRLVKIPRTLKPPRSRSATGIDAVKITPAGKEGHTHITVILNLFCKHVYLYPVKSVSAKNLAAAVWSYWSNFGHTDMVISDQGSDLTSNLFSELISLMGMRHVFSIANKHANGTEREIKEVVRHLRAMVYDSRISDVFDDPTVIPSVQYILNEHVSAETGYSPFELTFGSADANYSELLKDVKGDPSHVLLRRLNDNLKLLRKASKAFQDDLVAKRTEHVDTAAVNSYQPGDFVLFDAGPKPHPKLAARFKGPMQVVTQYKNDVQCRNLITDAIQTYSVEDLELFRGTRESAVGAAMRG